MMRKFIIRDYEGNPVETDVDLDNLDNILVMNIHILSGDEILTVVTKDGDIETWDSCQGARIYGFEDGDYVIFNSVKGVNYLTEHYLKLDNSYDRQEYVYRV